LIKKPKIAKFTQKVAKQSKMAKTVKKPKKKGLYF